MANYRLELIPSTREAIIKSWHLNEHVVGWIEMPNAKLTAMATT